VIRRALQNRSSASRKCIPDMRKDVAGIPEIAIDP
jgi:hypothetical protein